MKNFAQVAQIIEDIDLRVENARVETLQREMATIEAAIEAADQRSFAIERQLTDAEANAGRAMADALLAHRRPADAGPSEHELRAERDKLEAGIAELHRRRDEVASAIERIRGEALARVRAATSSIDEALLSEAMTAAEVVVQVYASVTSLQQAFGLPNTKWRLRKAIRALVGHDNLLANRLTAEVPASVSDLFAVLESKGAALPLQLTRSVRI